MIRVGTQPEDHVHWTQYRYLPHCSLYLEIDDRWLEIAGWNDFEIQNGYALFAPNALPAGCRAGNNGFFGVANVPREWEEHARIDEATKEIMEELV